MSRYPLPRNIVFSLFDNISRYILFVKHCLYLNVRKTLDSRSRTILISNPSRSLFINRRPLHPNSLTIMRSQLTPRPSPRLSPHLSQAPRLSPLPSPRLSQAPHLSLASSVVPPASSNSPISKHQRKSSITLLETVSTQKKQKCRHDPETAALLANYNVSFEDQEQEPPKKASKKASQKAIKKLEVNKSFFTELPRSVTILHDTYHFLLMLMDKEPLMNSIIFNITRSNVNIEYDQ